MTDLKRISVSLFVLTLLLLPTVIYSAASLGLARGLEKDMIFRLPSAVGLPAVPLQTTSDVDDASAYIMKMISHYRLHVRSHSDIEASYTERMNDVVAFATSCNRMGDIDNIDSHLGAYMAAIGIVDEEANTVMDLYVSAWQMLGSIIPGELELGLQELGDTYQMSILYLSWTIDGAGNQAFSSQSLRALFEEMAIIDGLLLDLENDSILHETYVEAGGRI